MEFEDEEPLERVFNELCDELCIDGGIKEDSWDKYRSVWSNYCLDGEPIQWLVCSLYQSVKQKSYSLEDTSDVPTVISLSRLLKLSGVSLLQFLFRMKHWVEMVDISSRLKARLSMIEKQFAVTQICFRKFNIIFPQVFKSVEFKPESKMHARSKAAKQKQKIGTSREIFSFTWTLFLQVKAYFPRIADDLVNCYHLLLVCLDWLYMNCLSADKQDLVNPDFQPTDSSNLSILDDLCERFSGVAISAKAIQGYYFRKCMELLFEKKVLRAEEDELQYFYLVLAPGNFDHSFTHLNNTYEMFILSDGDLDERIFLSDAVEVEIGMQVKTDCHIKLNDEGKKINTKLCDILETTKFQPHCEDVQILKQPQMCNFFTFGIQTIAQQQGMANRLQIFLHGKEHSFTQEAMDIFKSCGELKSLEVVRSYVNTALEKFQSAYTAMNLNTEVGDKYANLSVTLYYYSLDKVLNEELYRMDKDQSDSTERLRSILVSEAFHSTLFSLCVQLVLYSAGLGEHSDLAFPWILRACQVSPVQLFNMISTCTGSSLGSFDFPRDFIRHLNFCMESILLKDAWSANSVIWKLLIQNKNKGVSYYSLTTDKHDSGVKMKPGVKYFFKSMFEFAKKRINRLCSSFNAGTQFEDLAFVIFDNCMDVLPQIVRNRSLDNVILCCIYASSRTIHCKTPMTFVNLLGEYRRIFENVASESYRAILLDDRGTSCGDQIAFYNAVFISHFGEFIQKLFGDGLVGQEEALTTMPSVSRASLLLERGITSSRRLAYTFQGAPGREDVEAINATLSQHAVRLLGKRGSRQIGLGMDPTSSTAAKRMGLVGGGVQVR